MWRWGTLMESLFASAPNLGAIAGPLMVRSEGKRRYDIAGHTKAVTGLVIDNLTDVMLSISTDASLKFWKFDNCTLEQSVSLDAPASLIRIKRDSNLVG